MCGIVGIVDLEGSREIDREQLARMNSVQLHRGPDEGDVYIEPGVGRVRTSSYSAAYWRTIASRLK